MSVIKTGWQLIIDLIFPHFCVGCGQIDTLLCPNCYQQLEFYPVPVKLNLDQPALTQVVAGCHYTGLAKKLITTYKYQSVKALGKIWAELLYYTTPFPLAPIITAVPLHRRKARLRGFNQAAVVAQQLATLTGQTYLPLLIRTKHTPPQASSTDRRQRLLAPQKLFALNRRLNFDWTQPLPPVLIIDDVITTGATLNACAQILKEAGFPQVDGLVLAHGG